MKVYLPTPDGKLCEAGAVSLLAQHHSLQEHEACYILGAQ